MSLPRIKESERQRMLMDYVRDGTIPEGFYVKKMKDDRIQFRRIKSKPNIEQLKAKIETYKKKIIELEQQIENESKETSSENE